MNFPTNPFIMAIACGVMAYGIMYIYNKFTKDPEDESNGQSSTVKVCLLVTLISGLLAFYLKYAFGQGTELVTEHFEIGNPNF